MHYLFRYLMNNKGVALGKRQGGRERFPHSLRDPSFGDRQGLELWDRGGRGLEMDLGPLPPQTTLGFWGDPMIPQ